MEKLQAALERARLNRTEQNPATVSHPKTQPTTKVAAGVDQNWESIVPFDPQKSKLESNRIYTRLAGAKAAPFDILRTKVLLQMRQNGWRKLAVTSPLPNSGKTTIACNLALGLGRQADLRSMVLDCDLRDPSVAEFLGAQPPHSIGDMLTGNVGFADQALRFGNNVAFSMGTRKETDPTKVLLSEDTASVINQIEEDYKPDVMIFDLPSMLVNDDTRAFLKNVDCALIIARANKTRFGQFDSCEREIAEHTNVLGVVLNANRYGN